MGVEQTVRHFSNVRRPTETDDADYTNRVRRPIVAANRRQWFADRDEKRAGLPHATGQRCFLEDPFVEQRQGVDDHYAPGRGDPTVPEP